ncbi:hypothetical protein HYC85_015340 [Camellia sinensis]|uniref:Transcription factor CBF/NF-Y/archaeal histone domain-containing protein n=1 Tax=Camellia sinensis TaxID=4442 RepID=A0A7J7GWE7_CAMSI|nr:hypothetical protein HYC85_015340 [Camellia sinensis]
MLTPNKRCHHEQGKTVTAQDILSAMGRLGFEDYVEPLTLFLNHYRGIESEHTLMRGEPFVKRTTGDFVQPGPGNYGPQGFPVTQTQAQGLLDAHAAMMKKGMNSYYGDSRGGGSSSSSQAALPSFDPCGQFKRRCCCLCASKSERQSDDWVRGKVCASKSERKEEGYLDAVVAAAREIE